MNGHLKKIRRSQNQMDDGHCFLIEPFLKFKKEVFACESEWRLELKRSLSLSIFQSRTKDDDQLCLNEHTILYCLIV